ncbi:MAG: GDSL-type esterase/lipase family protein [Thermoplasmata archaeon]
MNEESPGPIPTRSLKIVGLGDSTTAGTPGYRSPLEAPPDGAGNVESQYVYWMVRIHPEWNVLNRGINGQRSDEILRRFARDVINEQPDYVIILAGVNDVFQGSPAGTVISNLMAMYRSSSATAVQVIASTILPYNSMTQRQASAVREVNAWVKETALTGRMIFCDTNALVRDPRDPDRLSGTPDGLHPDVAGYRRMGEGFAHCIELSERRPVKPNSDQLP